MSGEYEEALAVDTENIGIAESFLPHNHHPSPHHPRSPNIASHRLSITKRHSSAALNALHTYDQLSSQEQDLSTSSWLKNEDRAITIDNKPGPYIYIL